MKKYIQNVSAADLDAGLWIHLFQITVSNYNDSITQP